jgi:ligand-binding SRPBCC domain-containing protein
VRELLKRRLEHRKGGFAEIARAIVAAKMVAAKIMPSYRLEREQWLPQTIDEVFSFFSLPENLQILTPPGLDFRTVESPPTEICQWDPPPGFVDRESKGPYALWNHEHRFELGDGGTTMRDRVTPALWISGKDGLPGGEVRCRKDLRFPHADDAAPVSTITLG